MGLLKDRLPAVGGRREAPMEAAGRSAHPRTGGDGTDLKSMSIGEAGGVLSQATSCEAREMG